MKKETISTTLAEDIKLIYTDEDLTCSVCGKSLHNKSKYYTLEDPRRKCKECYNK